MHPQTDNDALEHGAEEHLAATSGTAAHSWRHDAKSFHWRAVLRATVAESITILDARFPWLRGAEKSLPVLHPCAPSRRAREQLSKHGARTWGSLSRPKEV
jgi:hypothetical protein